MALDEILLLCTVQGRLQQLKIVWQDGAGDVNVMFINQFSLLINFLQFTPFNLQWEDNHCISGRL